MGAHAIMDLHCDTLTAFTSVPDQDRLMEQLLRSAGRKDAVQRLLEQSNGGDTLDRQGQQYSITVAAAQGRWAQCCAIFVPDGLNGLEAIAYYDFYRDSFVRQLSAHSDRASWCRSGSDIRRAWDQGKTACILTVEGGSPIAGQLERIGQLAQDGVRMLTLTWNGENEIGSGSATDHGLSPFGRAAVAGLEEHGILVDVSHLNDPGFYDLLEVANKPFVASHSNARSVCGHKRNLTDDQIRHMVQRRCLIGLNYCNYFLRDDGQTATLEDLFRHIQHFLALGAQDALALGSDLDGADIPPCLDSMEKISALDGYLTGKGLDRELVEKLLWRNALEFWSQHLG